MINIVFIAYEFPPLRFGGVFRSLGFVKYLPDYGINPIVITLSQESYSNLYPEVPIDHQFEKEVLDKSNIAEAVSSYGKLEERSKWKDFLEIYFSIHGREAKYWRVDFEQKLADTISNFSPKAIYITVPPFSNIKLALKGSKRYSIPLIIDFRDAWSQWRTMPFGSRLHYWMNLYFERVYLKRATAVITTSEETLSDFRRLYPRINGSKFHYIPNGYDGELKTWTPLAPSKSIFSIGYVGSFYYAPEARDQMLTPWWKKTGHRMLQYVPQKQDWLYRSPFFFFKTLAYLKKEYPFFAKRIKVQFVGRIYPWLREMIEEFNLGDQVELLGEMAHQRAMEFQHECDLLLITSAKRLKGKDYSIAGKTFEYIQAQKPIIAFVSEGAQKDLLMRTGMALLCDPDDEAGSAKQIVGLLEANVILKPNLEFIATLSRSQLTGQLANIIKKVKSEK